MGIKKATNGLDNYCDIASSWCHDALDFETVYDANTTYSLRNFNIAIHDFNDLDDREIAI